MKPRGFLKEVWGKIEIISSCNVYIQISDNVQIAKLTIFYWLRLLRYTCDATL